MLQLGVGVVIAALGSAGLFAYLSTRRTTAGTVDTSDARTIWEQVNANRQSLESQLTTLRSDVVNYRNDAVTARQETVQLREKHQQCEIDLAENRRQLRSLSRRLKALEA